MSNNLVIKAFPVNVVQDPGTGLVEETVVNYQADYVSMEGNGEIVIITPGTTNITSSPKVFPDFPTAATTLAPTYCPGIVAATNTDIGTSWYSTYSIEFIDAPIETQVQKDIAAALAALVPNVRTTSTLSLSLVGTGATGTQIHATKDSSVKATVSTSATASIAGAATSVVALKICSTNNATEASWTTVATQETDQNVSLAIALQSVTAQKGQLTADVPAGWYVKLVNSGTGTHAEAFVSGQQTIYG